ncbi:MAG TPA: SigE family RNA polymerase sigma factor [Streptosporangiaceae bacterium]|nr:SigE family RNA polymerase sigma factor [Streptosporangiaceae bacterium]
MSFEEFVQGSSPRLFRTALLLTGHDRAAAEDLLQVALERAYRHWARICRSEEPERYVRRILANASHDRWRRASRRPERVIPGVDVAAVADDHAGAVADRDFLMRALAALPKRQRTVLVLRYYSDLSELEIADVLGCSVGTVKSQVSRGLARLRTEAEPGAAASAERIRRC